MGIRIQNNTNNVMQVGPWTLQPWGYRDVTRYQFNANVDPELTQPAINAGLIVLSAIADNANFDPLFEVQADSAVVTAAEDAVAGAVADVASDVTTLQASVGRIDTQGEALVAKLNADAADTTLDDTDYGWTSEA